MQSRVKVLGSESALHHHHQQVDRYLNLRPLGRKDTFNELLYVADVLKASIRIGEDDFALSCWKDIHRMYHIYLTSGLDLTLRSNRKRKECTNSELMLDALPFSICQLFPRPSHERVRLRRQIDYRLHSLTRIYSLEKIE